MTLKSTICLTVLGRERPGIVAAITGVLLDSDCNIRDSTMTLLSGEFAMMLIVELPEGMNPRALERALFEMQRRFDLTVATKRLDSDEAFMPRPNPKLVWYITIYGGDRKGIVHHVAAMLARKGMSILDLKTRVISSLEGAGLVSIRALAHARVDKEQVRRELQGVAGRFGVEVSLS